MPDQQPTIWDILGYEESGTYEDLPEGVTEGRRGGQEDMLSYLSDLLLKSKGDTAFEGTAVDEGYFLKSLGEMSSSYGKDFSELTEDEIREHLESFYTFQHSGYGGDYYKLNYSESDIEGVMPLYEALQEGMKAVPTSESFGLGRKIGDIETTGKRELKSASEGYIPGEILSRYGALQGKAGAKEKGEQLEQAYTEDIYGVQRGMGRDVRNTYEDFEDDWFGGVESWLGYLG